METDMKTRWGIPLLFLFLLSCQTVPVTERQQLSLIPSSRIMSMSASNYREFMSKHEVVEGTAEARMVDRVGSRIRRAVERYFREQGRTDPLEAERWEFNLIKDDAVNAWAMPGGKVSVYSGILPVAQNETGLAVVVAHEIAHVVANHGNERMSQGLVARFGGMALSAALSQYPAQTRQLFMAAYGVGSKVGVLLPYSRVQESEADHLGLIFMAMAGYDPRAAVDFWKRMTEEKSGGSPPEFLSTHPSDRDRIEEIRRLMPEAMDYYRDGR
jgi:predicted Zn-dependent protease